MEVLVLLVVLLPAADNELALLDRHVELIAGEPRDGQRDPQALGLAVLAGNALDVVGRIAVGGLGDAVERTLDLVESEQEGAGQRRNSGHGLKALASDFEGALTAPPDRRVGRTHQGSAPNMGSSGKARKNARRAVPPPAAALPKGGLLGRLSGEGVHSIDRLLALRRARCELQSWGREELAGISARGSCRAAPMFISLRVGRTLPRCARAVLRSREDRSLSVCPRSM